MSTGRRGRESLVLTFALIAIALVLLGAVWLLWQAGGDRQSGDQLGSIISALLALGMSAAGLASWGFRRRRTLLMGAEPDQMRRALLVLAAAVRVQWTAEARICALNDPDPMPVRWRIATTRLMDNPDVINRGGPVSFSGSSDRIDDLVSAFFALPRQRLVITGGPGTGKTTLAIQLLRALMPAPGREPEHRIPVMFSLASWKPDLCSFESWLTSQLQRTYPSLRAIAPEVAGELVAQDLILPVLDGLDEVVQARRAQIIKALNYSSTGLIMTSRRAEYRTAVTDAGDVLTGALVISPLALRPTDAVRYLRKQITAAHRHIVAWNVVLGSLAASKSSSPLPLARIVSTPLGLWLVRAVYLDTGADPTPLTASTYSCEADLRAHLLDKLIPSLVSIRTPTPGNGPTDLAARPGRRHSPDDLRRWLTTIAKYMAAGASYDWLWWNLNAQCFASRWTRIAARFAIIVVVGFLALVINAFVEIVQLVLGVNDPAFMLVNIGDYFRRSAFVGTALVILGVVGLASASSIILARAPRCADTRIRGRHAELFRKLGVGTIAAPVVLLGLFLLTVAAMWLEWAFGMALDPLSGVPAFSDDGLGGSPDPDLTGASMSATLQGFLLSLDQFLRQYGLVATAVIALATGFLAFFSSSGDAARATSPTWSYTADGSLALVEGLCVGLAFGLVLEFTGGYGGFALGIALSFAVRITSSSWFALNCAVAWEASRRRMPWRLMSTLADCHRLGLLRIVGAAYQFRHAELQDHLLKSS